MQLSEQVPILHMERDRARVRTTRGDMQDARAAAAGCICGEGARIQQAALHSSSRAEPQRAAGEAGEQRTADREHDGRVDVMPRWSAVVRGRRAVPWRPSESCESQ